MVSYFCNLYIVEINRHIITSTFPRYYYCMKRCVLILSLLVSVAIAAVAQSRVPQNKPYIDLRPLHFGISVGAHLQDMELRNVGPQTIDLPDLGPTASNVVCDVDSWTPGFSVGVVADLRLGQHLSLRANPTMHFGGKHFTFYDLLHKDENNRPMRYQQDMKCTYLSLPVDVKFSAQRFNNYRPYVVAGVSPMLNLSGKDQDYLQLKRYDMMIEVGLGCDFYLPFFKLIPELKFCYSLTDALDKNHVGDLRDANKIAIASSVWSAQTKMIMLTFYFE